MPISCLVRLPTGADLRRAALDEAADAFSLLTAGGSVVEVLVDCRRVRADPQPSAP
ncbi:hypothetical protein [Kineococcus sp. SYSU DK006]|uniref:hypothetical protein n=1 Tax=Kineococcus sp. SYSU DK006 TaxID=3383127 RepID=UPI003D7CE2D0